jgi:spoIIIJ-associated protein
MEWVETTGRSIDEAKELALDQLGVHEEDAEFDVVEEPRPGLFVRMRGEARVRARVRPTQPRPKTERRDRKRKTTGGRESDSEAAVATEADGEAEEATEAAGAGPMNTTNDVTADGPRGESAEPGSEPTEPPTKAPSKSRSRSSKSRATAEASTGQPEATARVTEVDREVDEAGRDAEREEAAAFLQGLATALGETSATTEIVVLGDDEAEVRLDGGDLGLLIGPRGQTLIAIQDLTRLAAQKRGADRRGRIRIDIAGYRERRREALARFTEQVASEVRSSGTARALEPMSSMDRKVVHDTANELDGVETISEGEEPFRRVVIRPISA